MVDAHPCAVEARLVESLPGRGDLLGVVFNAHYLQVGEPGNLIRETAFTAPEVENTKVATLEFFFLTIYALNQIGFVFSKSFK